MCVCVWIHTYSMNKAIEERYFKISVKRIRKYMSQKEITGVKGTLRA